MDSMYKGTGKPLRAIDLIIRNGEEDDYRTGYEPTSWQVDSFIRKIISWDYGIYDRIDLNERFFDYLDTRDECFTDWLLRLGYIQEIVKEDKWSPKSGKWVQIGWEDINNFLPGTMINRVLRGQNDVFEITGEVYWRDYCGDGKLLAIKRRQRTPVGYFYSEYYISDLFHGDAVYMRKK